MSCARYTKWPFHPGKDSAGAPVPKSLCSTSKTMQSIWRGTRGEGGEKVRDLGHVTVSKRLEGFSLCVENENMLRKAAGIFFVQEKRSSKEESNKIFYVSHAGNKGKQYKKQMLRDIKTKFLKGWESLSNSRLWNLPCWKLSGTPLSKYLPGLVQHCSKDLTTLEVFSTLNVKYEKDQDLLLFLLDTKYP